MQDVKAQMKFLKAHKAELAERDQSNILQSFVARVSRLYREGNKISDAQLERLQEVFDAVKEDAK